MTASFNWDDYADVAESPSNFDWSKFEPVGQENKYPLLRSPYESEIEYFKKNPNVAGMATEDEKVIFNPYSSVHPKYSENIYKNEASRILMKNSKNRPSFDLTEEQKKIFKGYGNDQDIRETIVARALSEDESTGNLTDNQKKYIDFFKNEYENSLSSNQFNKFDWNQFEDVQPEESYIKKTLKEIPTQFAKEAISGFGGTYGDILDLLGLQSKDILPGEQFQYERESKSTPEELINLVDADDVLPRYSRIPSSKQVRGIAEELGTAKEAETSLGKFAGRVGRFAGAGAAFGHPLLGTAVKAGAAGQALEELGAPEWAQAAGEIIATLGKSGSKVPLSSKNLQVQQSIDKLRKLGYSEKDLTLAKNALEDRNVLTSFSKMTPKAKNVFNQTLKNSEETFNNILNDVIPGLEHGIEQVGKNSAQFYKGISDLASEVPITNKSIFNKKLDKAIELMKKIPSVGNRKDALEYLEEGKKFAEKATTGDFFTEYYRGLGELGNWANPQLKESVLSMVKDGVKETLAVQGKKGYEYSQMFDQANSVWTRFKNAEDVASILKPAFSEEGANFKKLDSILSKPQNLEALEKAVGKEAANNLHIISSTAKSIENLEKGIKGGLGKELQSYGKMGALAYSLVTLDPVSLTLGLGKIAAERISTRLLTDPKFQNKYNKFLQMIKNSRYDQAAVMAANLGRDIEDNEGQGKNVQKSLNK